LRPSTEACSLTCRRKTPRIFCFRFQRDFIACKLPTCHKGLVREDPGEALGGKS
jgi:hypothetical protein